MLVYVKNVLRYRKVDGTKVTSRSAVRYRLSYKRVADQTIVVCFVRPIETRLKMACHY